MNKKLFKAMMCFTIISFFGMKMKAQMSGTYTVPSASYPTIGAIINALNTATAITGPVTIDVLAGHTETLTTGPYVLSATGTSANPIIFQRSGSGANPLIVANTGTATPASAVQDGIWAFSGSDYITIDGIDLKDPNTVSLATMEYGYGFFKAGANDGCQNNTIKNCTITMNKINNAAGNAPASDGSRGIEMVNAAVSSHTTAIVPTGGSGSNSNNSFYSNTIANSNTALAMVGYAATGLVPEADQNNDVGGNSTSTGNTITNFGGGGTTSGAFGVKTTYQWNLNVSYNTINSNNGSGTTHAIGIRGIQTNTAQGANTSITNNTVTVKCLGSNHAMMAIENTSGGGGATNTVSISNNFITNCTYTTSTSGPFSGINNNASAGFLSITSNTIVGTLTNINSNNHYNIFNQAAAINITVANNLINIGTFSYSGPTTSVYGIMNSSGTTSSTLSVVSNTLQGVSFTNTTGHAASMYLIYNSFTMSNVTMSGNVFNNLSWKATTGTCYMFFNSNSTPNMTVSSNSITGTFAKTVAGGFVYGSHVSSAATSGTVTVFGNDFSNVNLTGGNTTFYGINQSVGSGQVSKVFSNTVTNISNSGNTYGINLNSGTLGSECNNNLVQNISAGNNTYGINIGTSTGPAGLSVYSNTINAVTTTTATVYGLHYAGGLNTKIYKNKVYDLAASSSGGVIGINIPVATANGTVNVYNNLVGDLKAPAASNASNAVVGMNVSSTAANAFINVLYNSIYITGSSTGTNFGTAGVYLTTSTVSTAGQVTLKNNIVFNNSTAKGSGTVCAIRTSTSSLANYNNASNNNLFYAGTPGAANVLFYDGTNSYQTIGALKTGLSPREVSSVSENPSFASTTAASANFLDINPAIPTQIESGGTVVSGITDDYAGNLRNSSTPDIGAWEGNFTISDLTAPVIGNIGFTTPACNLTTRTFTANISDATGVASGTLSPRAYYKVNGGSYSSVAGTLTSGTVNNGVWTFVMNFTAVFGDVISQYVVAQDVVAIPNMGANPSAGFSATDVNTILTDPTTPFNYLAGALSGTYTVGSAGTFTTLTDAANTYNSFCLAGPVTFVLTDALYSTAETFPIVFKNNPAANSTNSLLIIPGAGVNAVITGASASNSVIKFLNSSFITMDGQNSGNSITINTSATVIQANIWLASTPSIGPGNNTIGLKNLTVVGSSTSSSNYCILAGVDGVGPATTSGPDNDNITIQGNTLLRSYYGIYANGTASVSAGGLDNWSISSNTIGPVSTGSNNIAITGINGLNMLNLNVNSNLVRNIVCTSGSMNGGIYLWSGINTAAVTQNTVTNLSTSGTGTGLQSFTGIYSGPNVINTKISSNIVSSIYNTGTTGYGARGIMVNAQVPVANVAVENNMVSDIVSYSDGGAQAWPIGIALDGMSGNISCDFNSVSLTGSHVGKNVATGSSGLFIGANANNLKIRNNIFSNAYDNSTASGEFAYGIYSAGTNTAINAIDYNDYFVGGSAPNLILGFIGSNQLTLPAIQTAFGGNMNSANIAPVFNSTTDLHLTPASNVTLDNLGTSITGITLDIDNQTRSSITPDMGADEFQSGCSSANGGTQSTTSYTSCVGQTVALSSSGFSTGPGITYQWQVATTSGGPYSNVVGGTGASTPSFTTGALTSGTYYYVLLTTCTTSSVTGTSNEATVTVNSIPTISVSASSSAICSGASATLTATGATSYTWSSGAMTASTVETPTATAIYTVTGDNMGCIGTETISLTVNSNPTVMVSGSTPSVCSGNSATLTASGATSYTWSSGAMTASTVETPTATTIYTVTGDNLGCIGTETISLSVTSTPTVMASSSSTMVCLGNSATLTASGATSYTWSSGAMTASTVETPTTATVYTVTGDNAGCIGTETISLTVNANPTVNASVSTPSVCSGNTVSLSASGATTYTWSTGALTATTVETPTTSTTYTVTGDNSGCIGTATVALNVNPNPIVTATSSATMICVGQSATLTASGANTYTWSTGTIAATTVESPTTTVSYTVTGEDVNGCTADFIISQPVSPCTGVETVKGTNASVQVYPNPNNGLLNIVVPTLESNVVFELYDALGNTVAVVTLTENHTKVNLSDIAVGIYSYRIKSGNLIYTYGKLVRQ